MNLILSLLILIAGISRLYANDAAAGTASTGSSVLPAILSITILGLLFGLILSVAKKVLHVEKDPRILRVNDALPGANCGACGLPGCSAYAEKIVTHGMDINLCPVGGSQTMEEVAKIMEIEAGEAGVPVKARVHCQGGYAETKSSYSYDGPQTCAAANELMGGFKVCGYGCLGCGDCVRSCPFDAIFMGENGLPVVDLQACTGCGKCVEACPRDIISLVPENFDVYVLCKNKEKAPVMKKGCSVGCIGCQLCVKACKQVFADNPDIESAITVDSFLATIDYDICTNCYSCVEVCPVPVIDPTHMSKKAKKNAEKKAEAKTETAKAETKTEEKAEAKA